MSCPNCASTSILGPTFGAIPGGHRRTGQMRCTSCRTGWEVEAANHKTVRIVTPRAA